MNIDITFGNDGFTVKAELKMDGNQWCVGIGANIQEGIYAFDKSAPMAIMLFRDAFRNH